MHYFYANKDVKEQFGCDAMIRMCILKVLKGHIEYLTKYLRTAKGIDKEQNIVLRPTPGTYGSTVESRSENKDLFCIKYYKNVSA